MRTGTSFRTRICIVAILIGFFAGTAWGNTQDQELAEKFSPILIMAKDPENPGRKVIFPEPVEIMGAESVSNLYFSPLDLSGSYIDTYHYSTKGWNPDLLSVYESRYPNIDFSQNKFAFLDTLHYTGELPDLTGYRLYIITPHFEYPGKKEITFWTAAQKPAAMAAWQ